MGPILFTAALFISGMFHEFNTESFYWAVGMVVLAFMGGLTAGGEK